MDDDLPLLAEALSREISLGTAGMDRFTGFAIPDIRLAAETLARYGLSTLEITRHAEKDERRLFLSERREAGRKPVAEIQLLAQLFSHFEPIAGNQRPNTKDPAYEEIALPRKLAESTADLRGDRWIPQA